MRQPTLRLLHIDDDGDFLTTLAAALGHLRPDWEIESCLADRAWLGCWVDEIGDGLTGYDALLLDYHLEGCTAEGMIIAVRGTFDLAPPVIVLSATDDETCRESCRAAGAYAYLLKPTEIAAMEPLLSAIESLADSAPRVPPPGGT